MALQNHEKLENKITKTKISHVQMVQPITPLAFAEATSVAEEHK
jgi:hypothetical protein